MKHEQRLVNYLGHERVESISRSMEKWYGPPIPILQTPGRVYAVGGGDFVGSFEGGFYSDLRDFFIQRCRRIWREWHKRQRCTANAGFSSLSDLISEATTGGKSRKFVYQKVGTAASAAANCMSLWRVGNMPSAAAISSNAPGGNATNAATVGAFPFTNPTGGDTQHFVRGDIVCNLSSTFLLYDRLFQVNKTMASTATEAVTGVPTRYQSTTSTAPDYIGGNFLFVEGQATLGATAHNWTVCTYLDQANAASTAPSMAGNSANIINRLDHPVGMWFMPLEAGDVGIKALTQMQCSASVTGTISFVIGHEIAFLPTPAINVGWIIDGINTAFNFERIFDDACLAFLDVFKTATTASTMQATIKTVAG